MNDKTCRFLGKEHDGFEYIVFEVKKAIDSLTKQLQIDIPQDEEAGLPSSTFQLLHPFDMAGG